MSKVVVDHLGKKYSSITELCKAYGILKTTFSRRIKAGWNIENALTKEPVYSVVAPTKVDHLGNEYKTVKEMCNAYNISYSTFKRRRKAGWSIKDSLTIKTKHRKLRHVPGEPIKDHKGRVYKCIKDMCKEYGISISTFSNRLNNGWSIEDALTKVPTPYYGIRGPVKVTDHLGNEYKSIYDMCKAYHIRFNTFNGRLERGWSLEAALTREIGAKNKNTEDHKGKMYKNTHQMCKAYGISEGTFESRLKRGWSIEKALTTRSQRGQKVKDHNGNEFRNVGEMCDAYNISKSTFRYRIKHNWSLENALTVKAWNKN